MKINKFTYLFSFCDKQRNMPKDSVICYKGLRSYYDKFDYNKNRSYVKVRWSGVFDVDKVGQEYFKIMKDNRIDIIYDILTSDDHEKDEEYLICLVAIRTNNLDVLHFLHNMNFNFNQKHPSSCHSANILTYACCQNNLDIIKLLVDFGIDIHDNSDMALLAACQLKNIQILEYFLLNFEYHNNSFFNAAMISIRPDTFGDKEGNLSNVYYYITYNKPFFKREIDLEIIDMILSKSSDINEFVLDTVYSFLASQKVNVCEIFIKYGMKLRPDAVMYACQESNLELIEFYLNNCVKVEPDVICYIIYNIKVNIIDLFMKYGIDFSVYNSSMKYKDIIQTLRSTGLDDDIIMNALISKCITSDLIKDIHKN